MNRLVKAELIRAVATRSLWWMALGAVLLNVAGVLLTVLIPGAVGPVDDRVRNAYQMAAMGYLFVMLIGVLGTAGAFRHHTVTEAFLIEPRRGRVIAAKLVAYTLIGLVLGVAGALAAVATAVPVLATRDLPVTVPGVPLVILGAVLGTALYATLGAALGVLLRNQVAAIVVVVLWFFYAEYFLVAYLDQAGRWLPGGAAKGLSSLRMPGVELLPAWAGGLVFIGYAAVVAVAAVAVTNRRDVT